MEGGIWMGDSRGRVRKGVLGYQRGNVREVDGYAGLGQRREVNGELGVIIEVIEVRDVDGVGFC